MKNINDLITDIHALFSHESITVPDNLYDDFGKRMAELLRYRFSGVDSKPSLRLSNLGQPDRKLWYSINKPESGEPLTPDARIKFLFGDILEELLLFLVQASGHTVEGRQTELSISGVKGHRDCIIDGHLVDCKSASSFSFNKFKSHGLTKEGSDPFGYIDQLNGYLFASKDDPLLKEKDTASFLVIDKQLGHICLDTYPQNETDYNKLVESKQAVLQKEAPPDTLCYEPIPEGKSGNMKLPVNCSYCPFKWECHPKLRKFLYSSGPVYLTEVTKEPRVPEITREGEYLLKDSPDSAVTNWL